MHFARSITTRAAVPAALGALALAVVAPAAGATTLKLKGGTTKLTFGDPALQQMAGMGIGFAPVAPASAGGSVLSFPIRSGTLKVKRGSRTKVRGHITHRGGMSLSNQALSIGLSKPAVTLAGKKSALDATAVIGTSQLPITMATLDLSKAKTSVTSKRVRITGVHVKLTEIAAVSMNAGFSVTGFTPGFEIGTATLKAHVRR